jgi:hypothetical protein
MHWLDSSLALAPLYALALAGLVVALRRKVHEHPTHVVARRFDPDGKGGHYVLTVDHDGTPEEVEVSALTYEGHPVGSPATLQCYSNPLALASRVAVV